MPILKREVEIFPEDLLARDDTGTDDEIKWWAVYTRSRQEKELMRRLHSMQIPFYCPIIANKTRSPAGRVRTSFNPLFTNYLFLYGDGEARYRALQTNVISQTLEVKNGLQLTHDLRQIQRLIQLGLPLTLEARLQPGARVRIKQGPFTGFTGVVLKRLNENYLFVAVNFLQQGVSVKIEDFDVEPFEE